MSIFHKNKSRLKFSTSKPHLGLGLFSDGTSTPLIFSVTFHLILSSVSMRPMLKNGKKRMKKKRSNKKGNPFRIDSSDDHSIVISSTNRSAIKALEAMLAADAKEGDEEEDFEDCIEEEGEEDAEPVKEIDDEDLEIMDFSELSKFISIEGNDENEISEEALSNLKTINEVEKSPQVATASLSSGDSFADDVGSNDSKTKKQINYKRTRSNNSSNSEDNKPLSMKSLIKAVPTVEKVPEKKISKKKGTFPTKIRSKSLLVGKIKPKAKHVKKLSSWALSSSSTSKIVDPEVSVSVVDSNTTSSSEDASDTTKAQNEPSTSTYQPKTLISDNSDKLLNYIVNANRENMKRGAHKLLQKENVVLPPGAVKVNQVPEAPHVFTRRNIPRGILNQPNMHTKNGTWGVLVVSKGALQYINKANDRTHYLVAPAKHVIEPMVMHEIQPATKDFQFILELYNLPN